MKKWAWVNYWTWTDTWEVIGLGALSAGVALEFGAAFGMITLGVVLLGYAIACRRAGVKK